MATVTISSVDTAPLQACLDDVRGLAAGADCSRDVAKAFLVSVLDLAKQGRAVKCESFPAPGTHQFGVRLKPSAALELLVAAFRADHGQAINSEIGGGHG